MPLMGEQAVLGAPSLLPSTWLQFRPQNSLMGSVNGWPDSIPEDGENWWSGTW